MSRGVLTRGRVSRCGTIHDPVHSNAFDNQKLPRRGTAKKTITAITAIAFLGTATLTPAPAAAMFFLLPFCCP